MGADIGEWLVGLRSNDAEVVEIVRRVVAPMRLDGADVFPNLSLYRGADQGRTRELHRLYRRGTTVLRTPSLGRLLRAAMRHLEAFSAPPAGLVPLAVDLLVGHEGVLLVNNAGVSLDLPERRLAKMGWRRADGAVLLDPATLEVVVPEPRLRFDRDTQREIDDRWPLGTEESAAEPGRYPVRAVVLFGARPDHLRVASPARRLASLASLLEPAGGVTAANVEAVGRFEGRVEVVRALGFEPAEVEGILRDLAG